MYVRNLDGDEFHLMVTSTNEFDLNSEQPLSFDIQANKVNDLFINDIAELWEVVDHDGVEHKVVYAKKQGKGNRPVVKIKTIPIFFDRFNALRIYETINEHMTANEFFTLLFKDTGFNFVLVDSFYAVQWEGFGAGNTRIKLFEDGLNRYKAEFRLVGNTVYLESLIGRDTSFMYRYKLNASDIVQEIDANGFWTYAKGFGNFAEGDEANAKLIREYVSPLASIPRIGMRHAPPIYDGRVTDPDTMDESLKSLVDESLKVSASATIHDLRKQGYALAQPELGDRTFLYDERINLTAEVRVNHLKLIRDWKGNVLDINITFGSESLTKRYQANLNSAVKSINQLFEGKVKLPMSVLDNAVIQATKDLKNVMTELSIPENGGWLAVDKNDPNKLVLFNAAGIGISKDGGQTFSTAMTGDGIVADVITAGILRGINIIQDDGQGGMIEMANGVLQTYRNNLRVMRVNEDGLTMYLGSNGAEAGTLRDSWITSDTTRTGISLNSAQDFISFGFGASGDTTNAALRINRDTDGTTEAYFLADRAYLPEMTRVKASDGSFYDVPFLSVDGDVTGLQGTPGIHIDVWKGFNIGSGDGAYSHGWGDYTLSGFENVFAIFVQVTGSWSSGIVAGVENISSTGFRVYARGTGATEGVAGASVDLHIIIIYEPS